jgi:MFS family permease
VNTVTTALNKVLGFVMRQKRNYRVAITRSAVSSFFMNLTAQSNAIYTVALGADSITLGTLSSIGNGISALISAPIGWLVDRFGIKWFQVLGIVMLAAGALTYALAPSWEWIIMATVFFSISMRLVGTGCSVLCSDSIENRDRATAQNLCVTLSSTASLVAPLVAAHLITLCGGLNTAGIRPLYYIRFVGYGFLLLFVAMQLKEPDRAYPNDAQTDTRFVDAFKRLFIGQQILRRWIVVSVLTWLPMAMTSPFLQLYAHEEKGANQYLLGVMTTAMVLTRLVFGIPLGRLADRIGRKKVIFLLTPLWYASNFFLTFSVNSATLILSASLQTFYAISSGITSAMTLELVPLERVGKWSGVLGLFRGLVAIPAPVIGGLVWEKLGPLYVFLIPLVIDLVFRVPLLATIPETLKTKPVV